MSGLAVELQSLEAMDLEGLRGAWRERYGEPPALRSQDLLRRMLAWRIQVDAAGGLSPQLRVTLSCSANRSWGPKLAPGAKLGREWRGVRYDVEVVTDGILYQGRTYDSLSAVARQITGVRWNGPRFFGLRSTAAA